MTDTPTPPATNEEPSALDLGWYKPGPSLTEFHHCTAFTRTVIGGRGSGKTTTVAVEALRHGLHNAGGRILGVRKTEISQADTTVETFNIVYRALGPLYAATETSLFRSWDGGLTVRVPSLEAIDRLNHFMAKGPGKTAVKQWLETEGSRWCSWILFRGLPDEAKRGNKLRGFECSLAIMVEADLLTREDYGLLVPCLRWKGANGKFIEDGIILDTNPPSPRHWIAKLEEETAGDDKFKFWHIPTAENEPNLPPGYVDRLKAAYKNNPAMYDRMVLGKYAEAFAGNPVYYAFDSSTHVDDNLPFPEGAYLVRGWDFGTTHAVTWGAYFEHEGCEYWYDLCEYFAEFSDVDRQCREVMRITEREFPFWNDRAVCAGVLDFCDPAGAAKKDTGSSLEVLATYGIHPGYRTKARELKRTIAIGNRLLELRDGAGRVCYKIDRARCPLTFAGLAGGYRYPAEGEPGYGRDEPGKGPTFGNFDHLMDAWRYPKINLLRLASMEVPKKEGLVGKLKRKLSGNPTRRW